jgi:Tol biopolymer transport system component
LNWWTNKPQDDEIYVMDADGQNAVNLTGNSAKDQIPSWTGDNQKIVFERDNNRVWIMDANGKNQKIAFATGVNDREPAVSPDGKFVIFQANAACGGGCAAYEAFVVDITAPEGGKKQLTFGGSPHAGFDWFDPAFSARLAVSPADNDVTIWGRIKQVVGW